MERSIQPQFAWLDGKPVPGGYARYLASSGSSFSVTA